MTIQQTDNCENGFGIKLELRREFLSKIPGRPIKVLDACSGSGKIWGELEKEFNIQRLRLDKKGGHGVIKMDSVRFLQGQNLSAFNVIDIDTYGEPWNHFLALKANPTRPDKLAVFLTYGFVSEGMGVISDRVKQIIGIPTHWKLTSLYGCDLRAYCLHYILGGVKNARQAYLQGAIYYIAFDLVKE